jgi:hypothetical protein
MEAACQSVARPGMTVRVPTTTEMKSDTWCVGPKARQERTLVPDRCDDNLA